MPEPVDGDVMFMRCIEEARQTYTARGVLIFMQGANQMLDGLSPIDLIERGRGDEVLAWLRAAGEGVFV
jgi:hypothetical protein